MAANLKDSEGQDITSRTWYKIMVSDGTELGLTSVSVGRINCGPRPSGQGAVFRYRRGHATEGDFKWLAGDVGQLKGLAYGSDGRVYSRHLSLTAGAPPHLAFFDSDDSYGFVAKQGPGNRIWLYARDSNGSDNGLRVQLGSPISAGLEVIGLAIPYRLALDCAFVPVGPYDGNWQF